MSKKIGTKKLLAIALVLAFSTIGNADNNSADGQFKAMNSEYQKKELIRSVTLKAEQVSATQKSRETKPAPDESVERIIDLGLVDGSAVVVEQAIIGVSKLKMSSKMAVLVSLYNDAQKKFGGYSERVRISVIEALGSLDQSDDTRRLIQQILSKDNGTVLGERALLAVKSLNDASLSLAVSEYAEKMGTFVTKGKQRGDDPLLYSYAQINATIAQEVLSSLTTR